MWAVLVGFTPFVLYCQSGRAAVSLSATSLSYGTVAVGTASASQSVTMTNSGSSAVTISSIGVTGTDASSFVFANGCGTSLAAGASCTIHGHFVPAAEGQLTATVTIKDAATGSPQTIVLNGTGYSPTTISLSAASLSFGNQEVGTTSVSQSVTLTNTGGATLYISSIGVTGTGASSFVFANNCGTSLPAGANCTIHGHFAPAAASPLTAAVTIVDSAAGSPQTTTLSGTGYSPTTVSLSATSLAYGEQALGTISASQSVTLTNTGASTLYVSGIGVTGTDASSYVFANSCGTSLAAGASCTIHGHFAPAAAGPLTAAVTIVDSAAGSPQTIAMSGTGYTPTTVSLSATSLAYGKQALGTISASQSVTLTNTGAATLYISDIGVTGTDASSFVFASNCGTSLAAGSSCTIHGHFAPAASGTMTAAIAITDSAPGSHQSIALTGTGGAATEALSINATSIGFGNVALNSSATQSVILTSTGTSSVTVNTAVLVGTGFSMSGPTLPVTLASGQSATIDVQFNPATAGAAAGTLTISSTSTANSTVAIPLTGTGTVASYAVDLSWEAPPSSPDPVAGYNVYRSPSGSSSYQLLNSTMDGQTTYTDTTVQAGLSYQYVVESVDSSGVESAPSSPILVAIP